MSEPTKRHTLSDAYRDAQHVIDQLTTRTASEPSASVELSRNAKGEVQFTVKTYSGGDADEEAVKAATERAYNQAVQAFDSLATVYPFGGA